MIRLAVDRQSPIPLHEQIKDQIKLALGSGELRPGDHLPSLRQVDSSLHVGLATVRRAYEELARRGIVKLERGRGAFISEDQSGDTDGLPGVEFEKLFRTLQRDLREKKLVPPAFARFFFSRTLKAEQESPTTAVVEESNALAADYVAQLNRAWQMPVAPVTIAQLASLPPRDRRRYHCFIADYYVLDLLKPLIRKPAPFVIPVDVVFAPEMKNDLQGLPRGSQVAVVLADSEYRRKASYIDDWFGRTFQANRCRFLFLPRSEADLADLLKSRSLARVYVGNQIWDALDSATKQAHKIRRPRLLISPESVERAWRLIGII